MTKTRLYIWILLILEFRLSFEQIQLLFGIDEKTFREYVNKYGFEKNWEKALNFNFLVCDLADKALIQKRFFLAKMYYQKYLDIIHEDDKDKAKMELIHFTKILEGHEKIKVLFQKHCSLWTLEEKLSLIKYRLKYALSISEINRNYDIRIGTISSWKCLDMPLIMQRELEILNNSGTKTFLSDLKRIR